MWGQKGGVPTPGREWVVASSGGVQVSLSLAYESGEKKERVIDWQLRTASAVLQNAVPLCCNTKRSECRSKAVALPIDLHSYPYLCPWALCSDQTKQVHRYKWVSFTEFLGSPLEIAWRALSFRRGSELQLLHIKRRQLWLFGNLIRMLLGCLLVKVFWARLTGRQP